MIFNRLFVAALSLFFATAPALAQTSPGLVTGQVPTAAQWNSYFIAKQDVLGFVPLNRAGGTMTGPLFTAPSLTSVTGLRVGPGVAPTSPVNGDVWTTSSGMFVRINGTTVGPLTGPVGGSFAATAPLSVTFPASVVTYALDYDSNFTTTASKLAFASIASGSTLANCTGSSAAPTAQTWTSCLDRNIGSTQGQLAFRNATVWTALNPSASAGAVLQSGGTGANLAYSTATYPSTTTVNQILWSSSANVIAGLATANSGVLVTSAGGVPSIGSTLPSAVQANITATGTILSGVWQGTPVALAFGGTNANLTASNGGMLYSTASAVAILAGTATANLPLLSGSSTTPSWAAVSHPTSATSGGVSCFTSTSIMASSGLLGSGQVVLGGGAGACPTSSNVASLLTAGAGIAISGTTTATIANSHVQNAQTGTTYTVLDGDNGKFVTFSNASSIAVTLPQAGGGGSFASGWSADFVNIGAGTVTITPTTSTINGGASYVLTTGQGVTIFSNATNYFANAGAAVGAGAGTVTSIVCNGLTITTSGTCPAPFDFSNCSLAAAVAANILTVSLKDSSGSDPSASSPCSIRFRSSTANAGTYSQINITAAQSITTNATGATLGSSNNTAFRFWVVMFDNGGTPVMALYNASIASTTSVSCYPINEGLTQSSTAISGSATNVGVYYTPNGTTVSGKAVRILGYVEYNSTGLSTAGTYATAPNFIQVMEAGIKRPCDMMQRQAVLGGAVTKNSTSTMASTNSTKSIALGSAANYIEIEAGGGAITANALVTAVQFQFFWNGSGIGPINFANGPSGSANASSAAFSYKPNDTAFRTIEVRVANGDNSTEVQWGFNSTATLIVREIQG